MTPTSTLFWAFILSLAFFQSGHAQIHAGHAPEGEVNPITVQSLDAENGLPQGFVNGIVQDKQGFIWMSTRGGLVRYDGYQVKVFKNDLLNPGTIASNIIASLYIDWENNLWILYQDHQIDIFNPVTESVRHISPGSDLGWMEKNAGDWHFSLREDSRHRYWVISSGPNGLQYFTRNHHAPTTIPVPANEKLIALEQDKAGVMWLCTDKALYTIKNETLHKMATLPVGVAYNYYRASHMVQDEKGDWVIGNMGCIEIYRADHTWKVIRTPFPKSGTRFVIKAPDGKIYLNSQNVIYRVEKGNTISPIWTNNHTPGDIHAMMIDRSNVMWIGTNTFGARMINLTSRGFHSYPYHYGFIYDVLDRLHVPVEKPDHQDNMTSYYFRTGVDKKGNRYINLNNPEYRPKLAKGNTHPFKAASNKLSSIHLIRNPQLWGQMSFDDHNNCWGIVHHDDSIDCRLVKIDTSTGNFLEEIPLTSQYGLVLYLVAVQNQLCLVYDKAVEIFDPKTLKSVLYKSTVSFGNASILMGLPDPHNDSIVWITSMGDGLLKLNMRNGQIKAFTEKDGIPSNTVYAVMSDSQGYLWGSCNKGIFRFNPLDHAVLSFTVNDGLQGNEFNRYHFFQAASGQIFFGGTRGWTSFYPDSVHIDHYQPPVVITDVEINNSPLSAISPWKDSAINTIQAIHLKHNQNSITFSYAGLQYNNPRKMSYRYQLAGFDNGWTNAQNQHNAHYTNIPPGHYTFKLEAANTAGFWSNHQKMVEVTILPPWWKTWWANCLYGIILACAGYFLYRNRINKLKIASEIAWRDKETEHLKKMDEIKTRFFSNITHEFRTPLSLVLAPLDQISKQENIPPELKTKISGIQRNANHLLRLINQLLDISKVEAGNMKISFSRGDLGSFIAGDIRLFDEQAKTKEIQLHFENALQDDYLFDADKWQKILFNLLSNAIKFTPKGGRIAIQISAAEDSGTGSMVRLSVSDTGIGIAEKELPFIFNRFYQADDSQTRTYSGTGIGLALTKELTELMNGSVEVQSKPGAGTLFIVSIPVDLATNKSPSGIAYTETGSILNAWEEPDEQTQCMDEQAPLILIVEDNVELNNFIAQTLHDGHRILRAFNGSQGLQIAQESLPDLIISDIMMPEMDGYSLCERIKQSGDTNHIAFMLLSAKASSDSIIKGLENYADDYITKPFHPDELLLRAHNLLDRKQKLQDHYNRQLTQPDETVDPAAINNPFLVKLFQVIEEHIDQVDLDVDMLANKMALTRRTLNRKLEALTGLSASRVVKQYRLKKAASLLLSGCNVAETAYLVGFDAPSYFSISFKEFYGVVPSEYARQGSLQYKKNQ